MARQRTQKQVSRRIDLNYFKYVHPLRSSRRAVVWLFFVGAIAFLTFFSYGGDSKLHNPGHLTSAHVSFENDCAKCHTGDGKGGFVREVTDTSCIKCHDGSIHSENQKRFVKEVSLTETSEKGEAKTTKHLESTNCMACHTEHRGKDLLMARDNNNCTMCHADLGKDSIKSPNVQPMVRAFDDGSHPSFGNNLRDAAGKITDPTKLRFNHAKHLSGTPGLIKKINGIDVNSGAVCIACHTTLDPQPGAREFVAGKEILPTLAAPKDRPLGMASLSDLRLMQEVSFDRHCIGCHDSNMSMPASAKVIKVNKTDADLAPIAALAPIAHEDLSVVRDQIGRNLSDTLFGAGAKPAAVVEEGSGRKKTKKETEISRDQWIAANLEGIVKKTNDALKDKANADRLGALAGKQMEMPKVPAAPTTNPAQAPQTIDTKVLVNYYTAYVATSSCLYCHSLEGELPTADPKAKFTLTTAKTGLYQSPRRWYAAANFDHRAHRTQTCFECHADAWTSKETTDFLSPDFNTKHDWKDAKGLTVKGQSCVDCHHAPSMSSQGAGANCTMCHQYHDRTKERAPDGMLEAAVPTLTPVREPATKPVAMAK